MSKHTPGPWVATPDPLGCETDWMVGAAVGHPDGVAVCNKRDAHLIAAAPDLLEACRKLVEWHGNRAGFGDGLLPADQQVEWIANAMRAIAKATGDQP